VNKPRCIRLSNLPPRLPAWPTATIALILDRFHPPGVVEGVVWTLVAIWWALALTAVWRYEPVDVIGERR
jgi:tryptophan-rich sensory protein